MFFSERFVEKTIKSSDKKKTSIPINIGPMHVTQTKIKPMTASMLPLDH